MNCKETGSFYTPSAIADWMVEHALKFKPENKSPVFLEPSVGDGVFVSALHKRLGKKIKIDAVELTNTAAEKVMQNYPGVSLAHKDFLEWEAKTTYDYIFGNPPYIVKKKLTTKQAELCKNIHIGAGLEAREVANIWTSFVVKCSKMLKKQGTLAFVLPTELLQVNYSEEIRELLLAEFGRVEIISFRKLAFADIEQDTVLLFATNASNADAGFYFAEVEDVKCLAEKQIVFEQRVVRKGQKWSLLALSQDDLDFLEEIKNRLPIVADLCDSSAGIVTAANDFFILSQADVKKNCLEKFVKPIIQKGHFVNGSSELTLEDYQNLLTNNIPCQLLDLKGIEEKKFNKGLLSYLKLGEERNLHQRYKCKLRDRWFDVPSVWKSEGFFFKRSHLYPKLLVNDANVYVTDSAYRIRMKGNKSINSFVSCFYTSLTMLFAELQGRYYGGGVLELTPNEFKRLPVVDVEFDDGEYHRFSERFRSKSSIEELLASNDEVILNKTNLLTKTDMDRLNFLYRKVKGKRLRSNAW